MITKRNSTYAKNRPSISWEQTCNLMEQSELRLFIDGCHRSKDYGFYFETATRVFNTRFR